MSRSKQVVKNSSRNSGPRIEVNFPLRVIERRDDDAETYELSRALGIISGFDDNTGFFESFSS